MNEDRVVALAATLARVRSALVKDQAEMKGQFKAVLCAIQNERFC